MQRATWFSRSFPCLPRPTIQGHCSPTTPCACFRLRGVSLATSFPWTIDRHLLAELLVFLHQMCRKPHRCACLTELLDQVMHIAGGRANAPPDLFVSPCAPVSPVT